ncbi:MAG: hypothetical protein ACREAS_03540 [Nitrososphaera sp.]
MERSGVIVEDLGGDINIDRSYAAINFNPGYEFEVLSGNVTRDTSDGTGTVSISGLVS